MSHVVTAERIIDANGDGPGWLEIQDGRILARGVGDAPRRADESFDVLLPGFLDIHNHGAVGIDFGQLGVDPTPAISYHHAKGTTSVVASIATAPLDATRDRIRELAPLVAAGELAGIHLEGPWIAPDRRGCHELGLLRHPDPKEVMDLVTAGGGAIRMITIAPELPGALESIRELSAAGVVAALGHTVATAEVVRAGVEAGATAVTHLFNGMPSLHHRDVGLPGVALLDERLAVELIADGVHVSDDAVRLAARLAGDRLMLLSDSMAAAGLGDGDYTLAGTKVKVVDGVARVAGGDSLAGSTSAIIDAVKRLLSRGYSYAEIVRWTVVNPANALEIAVPRLQPGDRADLVTGSSAKLDKVMRAGTWLGR